MLGSIGITELLVILAIVFVIFGAKLADRLPGIGRGIGGAIKNFKSEVKDPKTPS